MTSSASCLGWSPSQRARPVFTEIPPAVTVPPSPSFSSDLLEASLQGLECTLGCRSVQAGPLESAASPWAGRLTSTVFKRGREPVRAQGGDSGGCGSHCTRIGAGANQLQSFHVETCVWRLARRDWVPPSWLVVATLANRSKPSSKEDEPGDGERTRCKVEPRCAHCGVPPGDGVQWRSRPTTGTDTARCLGWGADEWLVGHRTAVCDGEASNAGPPPSGDPAQRSRR